MRIQKFADFKRKLLKDTEFKKEYDALESEFSLAAKLIELRLKENLTQKQLAIRAKTSQPAIARLESGKYKQLTISFLNRVAQALNSEIDIKFKPLKNL